MNEVPQPLKILVVEDEQTYSRIAHQTLEGHSRFDARTGADALRIFRKERPDIVLLDIGLPDSNGLDLLLEMKAERPDAYVVMFTASKVAEDISESLRRGADGYITKPLTRGKILKHIDLYQHFRTQQDAMPKEERLRRHREYVRLAETVRSQRDKMAVQARTASAHHHMLLYVDADAGNAASTREHLLEQGYHVEIAHSGEPALLLAQMHTFDCFLISCPVPDMEAAMLALKLRLHNKDTPLIVLLEQSWDRENPKWNILNISEFLLKPVKMRNLKHTINQHLEELDADRREQYI